MVRSIQEGVLMSSSSSSTTSNSNDSDGSLSPSASTKSFVLNTLRPPITGAYKPLAVLSAHVGSVSSLALCGEFLLSASQGKDSISCLAVHAGIIYSGSWDKTLKVWRLSDLKCLESIKAHDDAINGLVAGDGRVYSASADGKVKIWGKEKRKQIESTSSSSSSLHVLKATLEGRAEVSVNSVVVSGDGNWVYGGGSDGFVIGWEKKEKEGDFEEWRLGFETRGHNMTSKPVTLVAKTNRDIVQPVLGSNESSGKKLIENIQPEEKSKEGSMKIPAITEILDSKKVTPGSQSYEKEAKPSDRNGTQPSGPENQVSKQLELKPSVQELAAHAASLAMTEASKNIKTPKSAYEFENSWRSFSGDSALRSQLLKVTEDMDLAVKYIENLTKVPRFNMLVMCLTSTEKNELLKIWEDVFCNKATPMEYAEVLDKLRSRYCLKQ